MEMVTCVCGKSSVKIECVGMDLWEATTNNCKKVRDKKMGEERYTCNECGAVIDRNDMYMMVGH